jgi:hypothetical protein
MSNLIECIRLYRDDIAVNDHQFAAFVADAIDRDGDGIATGADFVQALGLVALDDEPAAPLTDEEREQVNERVSSIIDATAANERPTPEEAAAIVLGNFAKLADIADYLSAAVDGLSKLDDKRAADLAELTETVEFLGQRVDLRAEECRALDKRIDNVRILASGRRDLRPA